MIKEYKYLLENSEQRRRGCLSLLLAFDIVIEDPENIIVQEKEIRYIRIGKKEKTIILADDIVADI